MLILATGFQAHVFCRSIQLTGEAGLSLDQAWARGAESFEAVGLAGFPNFFMVGGPFSTVGNLSFITCAELEADYIVKLLQTLVRENATAIVPTAAAQQRFMEDVRASGKKTVWESGCDSWYLDEHGHVAIWTKTPGGVCRDDQKRPATGRLSSRQLISIHTREPWTVARGKSHRSHRSGPRNRS